MLYEYYECPGFENVRPCRGVRTDRYKLIHFFTEPQESELYDLQADPDEMTNLYGKAGYEELAASLKARLAALRAAGEYPPKPLDNLNDRCRHPSQSGIHRTEPFISWIGVDSTPSNASAPEAEHPAVRRPKL